VKAKIHTVGGLSAHADQNDLLRWLGNIENNPQVLVVHGEPDVKESFNDLLVDKLNIRSRVPEPGEVIDLKQL